jgi:diacylglycerol kinase family enzyme
MGAATTRPRRRCSPKVADMKPRGLMIANPNATSTSPRMRDVLTAALAHEIDLEVVTTTHRGHAQELGARAREEDLDLVITLGGDGTINETVNGLLHDGPAAHLPELATIPGGSANVLARALGFPNDPIEATGVVLESLQTGSFHTIGLGHASFQPLDGEGEPGPEMTHWFTINAGVGIDAEVIRAMEAQRAAGHTASGARYVMTLVDQFTRQTDRHHANLAIERPGVAPITGVFLTIIQNTAPWTYLGPVPINPCPQASFDVGLDVFAPHSLGLLSTARFGARMLRGSRLGSIKDGLTILHDQPALRVVAEEPTALQIDGDSMGMITAVDLVSVPEALRIAG